MHKKSLIFRGFFEGTAFAGPFYRVLASSRLVAGVRSPSENAFVTLLFTIRKRLRPAVAGVSAIRKAA